MKSSAKEWLSRLSFIGSEYPFGPLKMTYNAEGRLHKDSGFAYISPTRCTQYSNGRFHGIDVDIFGSMTFYFQGIAVPRDYILAPERLTAKGILEHPNAEVRYAGMLIYGYERMMEEGHLKEKHREDKKDRILFEVSGIFASPFCVVRVLNSTPEMDGSYKPYYLTVPPDVKTCQEAVAWTFGMKAKEYNPAVET